MRGGGGRAAGAGEESERPGRRGCLAPVWGSVAPTASSRSAERLPRAASALPLPGRAPRLAAPGALEGRPQAGFVVLSAARAPTASGPLSGAGRDLLLRGGQAQERRGKSAEGAEAALENFSSVKMPLEEPP